MKTILLFCEPRTGSNILCESMYMWKPIKVLWDFFVPRKDYAGFPILHSMSHTERQTLFEAYNTEIIDELIDNIQLNPSTALLTLTSIFNQNLIIKLHSWHFKKMTLNSLLSIKDVEVVILTRKNILQQYVSYIKAGSINKWRNVDTTNIRVDIDINEYIQFRNQTTQWYEQVVNACCQHNKKYLELTYEDDLANISVSRNELIRKFNSWFEIVNIDVEQTEYLPHRVMKQDYSNLIDSIKNWELIKDNLPIEDLMRVSPRSEGQS